MTDISEAELLARLEAARDDLNSAIGYLHGIEQQGAHGADMIRHLIETAHRKLYDGIPHRIDRNLANLKETP